MTRFVIIMGVSGCGKSTLGEKLTESLDAIYIEGDELHPPENIAKMSSGTALQDEDRWPWFDRIINEAKLHRDSGKDFILVGCSALKKSYRDYLFRDFEPGCCLLFLEGDFETIHQRMQNREHFMPASLLRSQFDTLESPSVEENCLHLPLEKPVPQLVEMAADWLETQ